LQFLNYDSTYISCLPNLPFAFEAAPPLPLCVNQSGDSCALNPTISGQVYVDYNGNGVKDIGDVGFPGVHVTANEGNWAGYTADDGSFSMKTGSALLIISPSSHHPENTQFFHWHIPWSLMIPLTRAYQT
jgi:hypothetical protein